MVTPFSVPLATSAFAQDWTSLEILDENGDRIRFDIDEYGNRIKGIR